MIQTSPAEILKEWLIAQGLVSFPNLLSDWPCYASSLPDDDTYVVDNVVAVYDVVPEKDGRHMVDGSVV